MTDRDWGEVGDLVCEILSVMYIDKRARFEAAAEERGCHLESLAAAAIAGAVRERVEKGQSKKKRPR